MAVQKGNLKSHCLKLHKDALENTTITKDVNGCQDQSGETELKEDIHNEEQNDVYEENKREVEVVTQDEVVNEEKTIEQEDKSLELIKFNAVKIL